MMTSAKTATATAPALEAGCGPGRRPGFSAAEPGRRRRCGGRVPDLGPRPERLRQPVLRRGSREYAEEPLQLLLRGVRSGRVPGRGQAAAGLLAASPQALGVRIPRPQPAGAPGPPWPRFGRLDGEAWAGAWPSGRWRGRLRGCFWRSRRSAWPTTAPTCLTPRRCCSSCCWPPGHSVRAGYGPLVSAADLRGPGRGCLRRQADRRTARRAGIRVRVAAGRTRQTPGAGGSAGGGGGCGRGGGGYSWSVVVDLTPAARRPYVGGALHCNGAAPRTGRQRVRQGPRSAGPSPCAALGTPAKPGPWGAGLPASEAVRDQSGSPNR